MCRKAQPTGLESLKWGMCSLGVSQSLAAVMKGFVFHFQGRKEGRKLSEYI